ncbi:MAG: hypothetical protein ABT940_03290 [Alphaproteobacteria bacterium]
MSWLGKFESVLTRLQETVEVQKQGLPSVQKPSKPVEHPAGMEHFHIGGDVERRVGALFNRNKEHMAGRVFLFDLSPVMKYLQANGMYVNAKCLYVAEQIVRKHMSDGDFFAQYRDHGFLVVFAYLSQDAARLKSAEIARTIVMRLTGGSGSSSLARASMVFSAEDGELQFTDVPSVDEIGEALARDAGRKREDGAGKQGTGLPPGEKVYDWILDAPGKEFVDKVLNRMSFQFMPMWSVHAGKIVNYVWHQSRTDEAGIVHHGYDAVLDLSASKQLRDLDLYSMDRFRARVVEYADVIDYLITLPIHLETLSGMKGRQRFMALCGGFSHNLRHHLIFEVVGASDGVVASRLQEIIGIARPFCRTVLLRLPINFRHLPEIRNACLFGLGTDVTDRRREDGMEKAMSSFVAKTHNLGLKAYVTGIKSPDAAKTAAECGFDHIAGPVIAEAQVRPSGIRPYVLQ